MVAIDMPKDLPQEATWTENRIWEKEVDEHVKWTAYLKKNICTLYSLLVWGQCSDIVQQRVEAMDTFGQMSTTGDGLMLLRAIKDITYNFQSQKYLLHSLHEAIYVKDLHAFPRENYYNTSLSGTIPEYDRCDPAQWWDHW